MSLKEKYALVTGGARGIGFACVRELLLNGIEGVSLVDINVKKGKESTALLQSEFGPLKVLFLEADVSKKAEVRDAFRESVEHWGHLDLVINDAGMVSEQNWEPALLTNCGGALQGTLTGFQYMSTKQNGRGGTIVNVASIRGISPNMAMPVYSSTKAFTIMLGRSLGAPMYYDHNGVKVITVCPGKTTTELMLSSASLVASSGLHPNTQAVHVETLNGMKSQSPQEFAKLLMTVLDQAASGTVWAIAGNKVNQIDFSSMDQQCMLYS
ncbi:hypothetical protein PPYR_14235 [Photinus pyralis]|uniref:Alcohol dehydrogenase n=1 Tax=Photinus pyralis TaxID=7054 RepID=A0A5N4A4M4_PHOPY|nr:15-hydroxyprostaglandin dehydrogenase [NAD(+)]-like [Photinus pyralis]KAB0792276.1 hypothetical protein PPYR_14235 [Photinus pyralis]